MTPNFQSSLAKLERLSPSKLDKTSRRIRGDMAEAEWKMGLCLLALKRSGSFRKLGFGTLSAYAERVLQLSGRKVGALLGAAEALEHLPLMSEAFRAGKICWSKVRVMHGLVTPETEAEWLEFARVHTSVEVERKVALSPLEWKRHRALKASLAGEPSVSIEEVKELLLSVESVACAPSENAGSERAAAENPERACLDGAGSDDVSEDREMSIDSTLADDRPAPPSPPRTIRLIFELTPDQYALYEQAESRVRAQEGRRLPRAEVLKRMAESVLSQGTAKARARHQVLVHTIEGSGEAWYETERGVLPVASDVLEEALEGQEILKMGVDGRMAPATPDSPVSEESSMTEAVESLESEVEPGVCDETIEQLNAEAKSDQSSIRAGESQNGKDLVSTEKASDHICDRAPGLKACSSPTHISDSRSKRTAIPNATIRRVFARAGHRCECCGRKGGRLDVHHRDPVSEGGRHDPDRLELLCRACHTKNHEPDFDEKPHWRAAREFSLSSGSHGTFVPARH